MKAKNFKELQVVLKVNTSEYWNTHYVFGKESARRKKTTSEKFIQLIVLNVILPIRYLYAQYKGQNDVETLLKLTESLAVEQNSILHNFEHHGFKASSAQDGQALLQLYKSYCVKNRCLSCAIGASLLK
jgi:hypothetical protein